MKKLVSALWRGDVPLGRVFWEYAIVYGSLLNLVTTFGFLLVLTAGGSEILAYATFFSPTPYNILMLVAVWRSADRYRGPETRAQLARVGVVVWALVATLA